MMRSWARRSFDAATIFIALVICCVFFTARMRRRRSMSDSILSLEVLGPGSPFPVRWFGSWVLALRRGGFPGRKVSRKLLDCLVQRALQLIVELFLLDDPPEHLGSARLDELVQLGLERA